MDFIFFINESCVWGAIRQPEVPICWHELVSMVTASNLYLSVEALDGSNHRIAGEARGELNYAYVVSNGLGTFRGFHNIICRG